GDPRPFVNNRLVVIVPHTNPARIDRLQDLAKHDVKLVLSAESVPTRKYSRTILKNLSRLPGYGSDYPHQMLANLISKKENVRGVVSKVQLGEADTGICYRSDVSGSVLHYVRTFEITDSLNVLATYPIATLKSTT